MQNSIHDNKIKAQGNKHKKKCLQMKDDRK